MIEEMLGVRVKAGASAATEIDAIEELPGLKFASPL